MKAFKIISLAALCVSALPAQSYEKDAYRLIRMDKIHDVSTNRNQVGFGIDPAFDFSTSGGGFSHSEGGLAFHITGGRRLGRYAFFEGQIARADHDDEGKTSRLRGRIGLNGWAGGQSTELYAAIAYDSIETETSTLPRVDLSGAVLDVGIRSNLTDRLIGEIYYSHGLTWEDPSKQDLDLAGLSGEVTYKAGATTAFAIKAELVETDYPGPGSLEHKFISLSYRFLFD
ncbi:MAG: hypothetical protein KAH44_28960 [Oricola sp.]|nr:hypothetical protein [Oricola sp.]